MRKRVETLGNKLESPCVGVCAIFEKISKYVEGTMKETILKKILRKVK